MMEACANLEEELTVDMPLDMVALRNLGLVNPPSLVESNVEKEEEEATVVEAYPTQVIYPAHFEPPLGRILKRYFSECLQRARDLREYERIHYADTLYQRGRRLMVRLFAHMKKNAKARPWEDYEKAISQEAIQD